jgi:methylase of polypeptide subunit release factors
MEYNRREVARGAVLRKLGLASLVSTSKVDISQGHEAHVARQAVSARYEIERLTIEAPAGIYHPTPDSSSLLFIRNLNAFDGDKIAKTLEIGAGCGAISLFLASKWPGRVIASDISSEAVESVRRNADLNHLKLEIIKSDLFDSVKEGDFDLIIFNTPLIDKEPESSIERLSLCDPEGRILSAFLRGARKRVRRGGLIIFSLCSNSAYEVMDDVALRFRIIALELGASGFWRAIVGAEI